MDFDATLHAEIQSARLALIEKIAQKMAFDWLVNKSVSMEKAFSRAKRGYYEELPTKEFSPEEKVEYRALWDKAATAEKYPNSYPAGMAELSTDPALSAFRKLSPSLRWQVAAKIEGVLWCCENCGEVVDDGAMPKKQFMGSLHCGNCDLELTRRTGGGQSDPFNFTFKPTT